MMYDNWGWNQGSYGFGLLGALMYLVIFIDLVLLGIWLYKQISKKK
jgi:hypothetical protein